MPAVYDYEYTTPDGQQLSKLVFLNWCVLTAAGAGAAAPPPILDVCCRPPLSCWVWRGSVGAGMAWALWFGGCLVGCASNASSPGAAFLPPLGPALVALSACITALPVLQGARQRTREGQDDVCIHQGLFQADAGRHQWWVVCCAGTAAPRGPMALRSHVLPAVEVQGPHPLLLPAVCCVDPPCTSLLSRPPASPSAVGFHASEGGQDPAGRAELRCPSSLSPALPSSRPTLLLAQWSSRPRRWMRSRRMRWGRR